MPSVNPPLLETSIWTHPSARPGISWYAVTVIQARIGLQLFLCVSQESAHLLRDAKLGERPVRWQQTSQGQHARYRGIYLGLYSSVNRPD